MSRRLPIDGRQARLRLDLGVREPQEPIVRWSSSALSGIAAGKREIEDDLHRLGETICPFAELLLSRNQVAGRAQIDLMRTRRSDTRDTRGKLRGRHSIFCSPDFANGLWFFLPRSSERRMIAVKPRRTENAGFIVWRECSVPLERISLHVRRRNFG